MISKPSLALFATAAFSAALCLIALYQPPKGTFLAYLTPNDEPDIHQAFLKFITKYQKSYLTTEEYDARYSLFKSNYLYIKAHQSQDYKLAVNWFTDTSVEEREKILQSDIPDVDDDELLRD